MEHACGTDGQTRSTRLALMDKQHMLGTNEQTGSTCVALMGRAGAHAWHGRVGMEHTCDTDGWTDREHTCGTASISAHACERRAEPEPQPPAGTGRPISPPRGPPWPPSPPPPRGRSGGTVSRPPRSPRSGGARSRRGTAAAAGREADAEGGGAERGIGAGVRPLSPAPGAGRTAAAPGPALGRGAALPVRRDEPRPLRSTEGAAGRSRSWRRVADPPLFTFPAPLPLPPRLLPGSAAARQVPASAPAGPSRRTRAPAPRRPFVWDRHRDPRPPTPPAPPGPPAPRPAIPLSRTGPYGRGAGERGGKRRPGQGSASHRSRGGGSSCPGAGGWSGGGRPVGGGEAALTGGIPLRGGGGRRGAEEAGTGGRAGGRREGGRGTSRSRL